MPSILFGQRKSVVKKGKKVIVALKMPLGFVSKRPRGDVAQVIAFARQVSRYKRRRTIHSHSNCQRTKEPVGDGRSFRRAPLLPRDGGPIVAAHPDVGVARWGVGFQHKPSQDLRCHLQVGVGDVPVRVVSGDKSLDNLLWPLEAPHDRR